MKKRRKRRKRKNNNYFLLLNKITSIYLFAFIFFISFSCKEKKDEIIHLNFQNSLADKKKNKKNKPDSIMLKKINYFDDLFLIDSSSTITIDSTSFIMDRFSMEGSLKFLIKNKKSTTSYYSWEFSDTMDLKNAFYNWLDCFGMQCNSVKLYDTIVMDKSPFLIFTAQNSLIYIKSNKNLKHVKWLEFLNQKFNSEKWKILIEQKKKQNVCWYKYEELQFMPMEEKTNQ